MYLLVLVLFYAIAILPFPLLYALSDGIYFILYYLVGYRKKVVLENLQLAFPNKELNELRTIRKKFFKHFTDIFIESIKAFSIHKKTLIKRYKYTNPELIDELYDKGRSIAFMGSHQANWEWSISIPLVVKITCFGAYTRIGNSYFDKTVKDSRTKFGFIGYKTTETIKSISRNFDDGIQGLYLLLSDQSPQVHKTFYWSTFFGVKVPIHTGAEMLAKKFDLVVINYVTRKVKRGYYETEFQLITETPKEFDNYQITDKYLRLTERNVIQQPELYLWSHKRFKHRNSFDEWQKMRASKQKTKK